MESGSEQAAMWFDDNIKAIYFKMNKILITIQSGSWFVAVVKFPFQSIQLYILIVSKQINFYSDLNTELFCMGYKKCFFCGLSFCNEFKYNTVIKYLVYSNFVWIYSRVLVTNCTIQNMNSQLKLMLSKKCDMEFFQ